MPKNKKNSITTTMFNTWLDEHGICRTVVQPNAVIELQHAKENTAAVIQVSNGSCPPILVDIRLIKSINKEARDHFTMRGRKPMACAIAILVNSALSKVVGNFYLGINVPVAPTRLFTSEKKALNWLRINFIQT